MLLAFCLFVFVVELLERDPKKRLGSSKDDAKEIMNHAFFDNIDWKKLKNKEIEPRYKPSVKNYCFIDKTNCDQTIGKM